MIEIFMPKAGMDMKEGVLVRWLKKVGDPVEKDEPIMEIETDKITMEAEAPASGFFIAQCCEAGDVIPVLGVMGYIGAKDEAAPQAPPWAAENGEEAPPGATAVAGVSPSLAADAPGLRATPYARRLARAGGIQLASLIPTGKHGEIIGADIAQAERPLKITPLARRIAEDNGLSAPLPQGSGHAGKVRKDDVLKLLEPAQAPGRGGLTVESRRPLSNMNSIVADRMFRSHTEIPNVTQSVLVDMTELLALCTKLNARREQRLSINDFVLKATAIAVKEHPKARTIIAGGEYITFSQANIGFAVSVDDGLYVPVLHNADQMPLPVLSARAKDLAQRARNGGIKPDECSGGVFTVSNMGMFDVWDFTPIINQPEPGILGIGAARDALALAPDGSVTVKKICKMFITYDHRIMDGVSAAKIKLRIRELLEHPEDILLYVYG